MPLSGCFSCESSRPGLAEDRSEMRFFPFQPFPGKPVESHAAFSFRTCPDRIGHSGLNVHQTFSAKELAIRFGLNHSQIVREFQASSEIVASDPPRAAMEGASQSFIQLRLSRLRRGFEHEHEHDNEHDFRSRRKEPQIGESSARLRD